MFRCILISPPLVKKKHIRFFNIMLKKDIVFHLRIKDKESLSTSEVLDKIYPELHSRIVIHQHFENEKLFSLKGIHMSESNRASFTDLQKKHQLISASIHTLDNYDILKDHFQYLLYSPVFPSISKPKHHPVKTFDKITEEMITIRDKDKLIALGGITKENVGKVRAAGFAGAAILGSVWNSKNPVDAFYSFIEESNGVER